MPTNKNLRLHMRGEAGPDSEAVKFIVN